MSALDRGAARADVEIDDDDDDEQGGWAAINCSKGADGQCGQAGTEYCDFECPFR